MSGIEPLVIGSVVSGAAGIAGTSIRASADRRKGEEEARSAEFEAQQLKIQQETLKIAATQDEAKRRNELTSSLETIAAIRAGRGVGGGSPGGMAIFDAVTANAERDVATSKFNYLQKGDQSRQLELMSKERAKTSLLAGRMNEQADWLSGIGSVASIFTRRMG